MLEGSGRIRRRFEGGIRMEGGVGASLVEKASFFVGVVVEA